MMNILMRLQKSLFLLHFIQVEIPIFGVPEEQVEVKID